MNKGIIWKYNIGDIIERKVGRLYLLDKTIQIKEYYSKERCKYYLKREKYYKYSCLICGYQDGVIRETDITKGVGCSCCANITVVKGINDLATTRPDLVKYFENKEDAFYFSSESNSFIQLKCPTCGRKQKKRVRLLVNNGFYCDYCNSVGVVYPELKSYFLNQEDSYKYSVGSHSVVSFVCPICRRIKELTVKDFVTYGLGCVYCSDTLSFGEKYLRTFLAQLDCDFICQLNRKQQSWCASYRYDFYIPSISCIIETHGAQHYYDRRGYFGDITVEEQKEIDLKKKKLALENNILHYIEIDTTKGIGEKIKGQILNSDLGLYFDLSKIDWGYCLSMAHKSVRKIICDFYNANPKITVVELSKIFKLHEETIRKYLKEGTVDGWCDYKGKDLKFKDK